MSFNNRLLFANDSNASIASLMSVNSPSVRGSTSKYAGRFLDSSNTSQLSNVTLTNWSRSASELPSQLDSTLTSTINVGDSTLVEDDSREMSESCSALHQLFCNALQNFYQRESAFELVQEFEGVCCDHIVVFQNLKKKRPTLSTITQDQLLSTSLEKMVRIERNTWRLARILFGNRMKPVEDESMSVDEGIQSDTEVVQNLLDRNKELCQMQMIIDWLELNEFDDLEEEEDKTKIQFYSDGPHYWENTLHAAKSKRNKFNVSHATEREFSSQMDPDAPIRTKKSLHDLDKEDETRVLKYIFKYLRAGQINMGQELAQTLGFHWLAAALDGWRLHHDPNYPVNNSEQGNAMIEGNSCRDLWKYACWEASKMADMSVYEKAVFGALSGNVNAILPVCHRWTDKLWAYYRASIDVHVEKELRSTMIQKPVTAKCAGSVCEPGRASVELSAEYWSNARTDEEIFREVDALMSEKWSPEEQCHSLMQRNIAVNNVDALLDVMVNWIRTHSEDQCYSQMLRFFAHLILFLKSIEVVESAIRQEMFTTIVESYINYLIETKSIPLIATYVSTLPRERQIVNYTKLLERITDSNERRMCVKLARDAGLDIEEITKSVVETSVPAEVPGEEMEQAGDITKQSLKTRTTSEDSARIDALDWLMINQIQYIELIKQANALMRTFCLTGKVEAARAVLNKVPLDIVEGVTVSWCKKTGSNELSTELNSFVREYVCYKSFFEVQNSFDGWLRYFHNSKPIEPVKPTSKKFTDLVAYEHSCKGYENDMLQWRKILADHGKLVSSKIIELLQFPEGGWMRDPCDPESAPSTDVRTQQMNAMRKKYIPQLAFMVHTVLHSSNLIKESIQFAETIASEEQQLYAEFTPDLLKDFLRKIRESSLSALNEGLDALGYPNV